MDGYGLVCVTVTRREDYQCPICDDRTWNGRFRSMWRFVNRVLHGVAGAPAGGGDGGGSEAFDRARRPGAWPPARRPVFQPRR